MPILSTYGKSNQLTCADRYPWIAPVIGLAMTGVGFFTIFQAALNYLVDTFHKYAASAVAANSESFDLHQSVQSLTQDSLSPQLLCWRVSAGCDALI